MLEGLKQRCLRLLKVPPEPSPPPGSESSVRIFRAAENYLKYNLIKWGIAQLITLFGIILVLVFLYAENIGKDDVPAIIFRIIEFIAIMNFLLQIPFTLMLTLLDYEQRWYILTDRSLRIREGIRSVKEQTLTFANIQNMSIKQGPIQRFFGLQDLEVSTAGGGGMVQTAEGGGGKTIESPHTAYFRGVDNAEEIRDIIVTRLRRLKDTGLGDPDEERELGAEVEAGFGVSEKVARSVVEASLDLYNEVRMVRHELES